MKKFSKKDLERIEECFELLERDHGNCEDSACDLRASMESGNDLWAIKLWSYTGASCDEFNKIYNSIDQKKLDHFAEIQLNQMLKEVEHKECECGAVVWNPDDYCDYCSSCGESDKLKEIA